MLTHICRLADRDTFMRFRGGGIGHMYMRHIEPWLDATGWGTMWPSLHARDPDPDIEPIPLSQNGQATEGDGDSENEDSSDEDSDMEDGDGEDLEQPESEEGDSDEDDDDGEGVTKHREHLEGGSNGDDIYDDTEEPVLQFASL